VVEGHLKRECKNGDLGHASSGSTGKVSGEDLGAKLEADDK